MRMLWNMLVKELIQLKRDPRILAVLFIVLAFSRPVWYTSDSAAAAAVQYRGGSTGGAAAAWCRIAASRSWWSAAAIR